MSSAPKPPTKKPYNQSLPGVYGELGISAGTRVFYLQAALRPQDLQKTSLISDIAGSERWPVRDLFQREVDVRRVSHGLLPYLQDSQKVRFFNPITLTILPMNTETNQVLLNMPDIPETDLIEDATKYRALELPGFYRFRHVAENAEWGLLEWDDSKTRLVAIDGQHRLSALKRLSNDRSAQSDFLTWSIPVVIVSFRSTGKGARNILEVVRSIFIYINREARIPNKARQILLTDESINSVCSQELLQLSHDNDLKPSADRDPERLPLLFFDWRGEEDEGNRIYSPAAIKSIEEIFDWFDYYLLGDDFSLEQETALGVQPLDLLKRAFASQRLTPELTDEVRTLARDRLLPGLSHLLERFTPYQTYGAKLRSLEEEFDKKSDVSRHAFYQLRFGTNRAGDDVKKAVQELHDELVERIGDLKAGAFSPLLQNDIGMRGVLAAFGELKQFYEAATSKAASWLEYSDWFTKTLNKAYEDNWLHDSPAARRNIRRHVTEDEQERVVNYRLEHAFDALGALLGLVLIAYGRAALPGSDTAVSDRTQDLTDRLQSTLLRGYKKEVRPRLRQQFPAGGKPLTDAVRAAAEELTEKHLKRLEDQLRRVGK